MRGRVRVSVVAIGAIALVAVTLISSGGLRRGGEPEPRRSATGLTGRVSGVSGTTESTRAYVAATSPPPPAALSRACSNNIGIGSGLNPSVTPATDLMVGPARFAAFDDARRAPAPTAAGAAERPSLSMKVPLIVGGTDLPAVRVRISTVDGSARVGYDGIWRPTFEFDNTSEEIALETAVSCGYGADSWVAYNGGVIALHPTCAVITVLEPSGIELAQERVGLFGASC